MGTWDALSLQLKREARLPPQQQQVSREIKVQLQRLGLTWDELLQLRKVTDYANRVMHQGKTIDLDTAMSQLESQPMPEGLQDAKPVLMKALQCLARVYGST